ncbi:MAG: terminase small subunit [Pseudomonadota bacterium]
MPRGVQAFSSPDELNELVDGYFEKCADSGSRGSMVGLANHLAVPTRTLRDYRDREGFGEVLEFAKQRIEADRIDMLFRKDVPTAGVIFDLVNNFGWHNTMRNEHSGPKGSPVPIGSAQMPAGLRAEIDAHVAEVTSVV